MPLTCTDTHPGGANPAIRTLFYRLVRLLSLTIVPIFVFDGPNKPAFKRNKRSRGPGDRVSAAMARRMIRLFGFAAHDAPGEAEAECALLQRRGVVDAVLSEDVDTIMFGCGRTLRNWSAESAAAGVARGGSRPPTHVSLYDVADLRQGETGLDREGMVLVALMSGGDYIPEGVPGCGVKVACEAARAGYGTRLCRIKRSDPGALQAWREDLMHELRTNESKSFRVRHKALTIPEEFPDMDVLRYYTHPVVSEDAAIERLRAEIPRKREIDIVGLRDFTAETFDWSYKIGAVKFIRVFAPGLLVQALMNLSREDIDSDDPDVRHEIESKLVLSIKSRRAHFSTDATPELRIAHIPNDIVGLDLDAEEEEVTATHGRSGLALNSDDEGDGQPEDGDSGPKKVFDPLQPDLAWVPESVAKLGVPLTVKYWEGRQRAKQMAKDKRAPAKRTQKKTSGMPAGALDKYVKITKPSITPLEERDSFSGLPSSQPASSNPPASQQPRTKGISSGLARNDSNSSRTTTDNQVRQSKASGPKTKLRSKEPSLEINPWSIASSQTTPKAKRTRSLDKHGEPETILISSSPIARPSPPPATALVAQENESDDNLQHYIASPTTENQQFNPPTHLAFSIPSSPPRAVRMPDGKPSPRKHTRSSGDATVKPAAKRTQRSSTRDASPSRRRPARQGHNAAQPSIKSFGRLTEAMSKNIAAPAAKAPPPPSPTPSLPSHSFADGSTHDVDEDSDLEDVRAMGSRRTSRTRCVATNEPDAGRPEDNDTELESRHNEQIKKTVTTTTIEIPSSPIAPFESSSVKKTRIYIPRTSDTGLGYFREVEVTRDEADRMMREEQEQHEEEDRRRGQQSKSHRISRTAGAARRMWRESDVTILDLTGED